jgi:hypothetical protein
MIVEDMVGRRCLRELGMCGRRKEGVFLSLLCQNRVKTSGYLPLVVYIDLAEFLEMAVCAQPLDSACTAECFEIGALVEFPHESEVVMLKMILPFSRDLQDVS